MLQLSQSAEMYMYMYIAGTITCFLDSGNYGNGNYNNFYIHV